MYLLKSHLLQRLSSSSRKLCKAQQVYHTLSQTSIPCNGMPVLRTRNLPFKSPEVHYTSFLILSIHLLKRFRPTNVICLRTCNVVPKPQCIFWTVCAQPKVRTPKMCPPKGKSIPPERVKHQIDTPRKGKKSNRYPPKAIYPNRYYYANLQHRRWPLILRNLLRIRDFEVSRPSVSYISSYKTRY